MQNDRFYFDFFLKHLHTLKNIFKYYQYDDNQKYLIHFNRVTRQLNRLAANKKPLTIKQICILENNLYSIFIKTKTISQYRPAVGSSKESAVINNLIAKINYETKRKKFIRNKNKKIPILISQRIHNYMEKADLINLKDKYLNIFQTALSNYMSQVDRPGYEPTLFTRIRHSRKKYAKLIDLETQLKNESTMSQQKDIIKKWLKTGLLQNDNHSFRNYFVDALIELDPHEDWHIFDNHKIVFYDPSSFEGPNFLYRGTALDPEIAFVKGMQSGYSSKNIAEYVSYSTDSTGVSTSKNFNVANLYTNTLVHTPYGPQERRNGYVFQIHYRGCAGIDIDKSLAIKDVKTTKQEVNIIDCIPPEDIVSYGHVKDGTYSPYKLNVNYKPDKKPVPLKRKASLLRDLFTSTRKQTSNMTLNKTQLQSELRYK